MHELHGCLVMKSVYNKCKQKCSLVHVSVLTGRLSRVMGWVLFESLQDVIRDVICVLIRDGLLIEHLHACPVLGVGRGRPGIPHLLHNVFGRGNLVRVEVLLVEGLLRVDDIAAIRMAGGTVVVEQHLAGMFL